MDVLDKKISYVYKKKNFLSLCKSMGFIAHCNDVSEACADRFTG
jgi:hypothetical protein